MTVDVPGAPPARPRTRAVSTGQAPGESRSRPANAWQLVGSAPVTPFEDRALYEGRLAEMIYELGPTDAIERMWVKDIVDLQWDIDRARRAKAAAIPMAERGALAKAIDSIAAGDADRAMELAGGAKAQAASFLTTRWAAKNPDDASAQELLAFSAQPIKRALGSAGLSEAQSGDLAFLEALRTVERLDALIHTYSRRRDAILRDLERRRGDRASRVSPPRTGSVRT